MSCGYNRYSYVRNNPLTNVDPSGFSWWSDKVTRNVRKYWRAAVVVVIAVTISFVTYGAASGMMWGWASAVLAGAAGGTAGGFFGTLIYGGNYRDAWREGIQGGWEGAWTGALGGAVAGGVNMALQRAVEVSKWMMHGVRAFAGGVQGGVVSLAKGDNVEAGFLSGLGGGLSGSLGQTYSQMSDYGLDLALAAVVGGSASVVAGGKFMNGAITGAAAAITARLVKDVIPAAMPEGAHGPAEDGEIMIGLLDEKEKSEYEAYYDQYTFKNKRPLNANLQSTIDDLPQLQKGNQFYFVNKYTVSYNDHLRRLAALNIVGSVVGVPSTNLGEEYVTSLLSEMGYGAELMFYSFGKLGIECYGNSQIFRSGGGYHTGSYAAPFVGP